MDDRKGLFRILLLCVCLAAVNGMYCRTSNVFESWWQSFMSDPRPRLMPTCLVYLVPTCVLVHCHSCKLANWNCDRMKYRPACLNTEL